MWAGRWGTRGPKLDISAPDTSPQSPMARPPAAAALQDSGPGKVSLPGVLEYGSVPSRTLRTGIPSGHILVTVCPLVTHLVPPMNLSSGSHLTRSSPSQGTFWRRPSSLGGNWCRVPQMWSPMETWPESEKGPTSWAALRGHCLCPQEFPHSSLLLRSQPPAAISSRKLPWPPQAGPCLMCSGQLIPEARYPASPPPLPHPLLPPGLGILKHLNLGGSHTSPGKWQCYPPSQMRKLRSRWRLRPAFCLHHVSLLSPAWCGRMGLGQVRLSK